jgi:putative sporulation protein YyaC
MKHYFGIHETARITTYVEQLIENIDKDYKKIVIVCIGTDRSTGDSLGPYIGTLAKELEDFPFEVLGTLDDPVHAKNLEQVMSKIDRNDTLIIAIDACLGQQENIGKISVHEGSIKPGSGVGKDLPPIGDISITGVVNFSGFMSHLILQNTRLSLIYKMAKSISKSLQEVRCYEKVQSS